MRMGVHRAFLFCTWIDENFAGSIFRYQLLLCKKYFAWLWLLSVAYCYANAVLSFWKDVLIAVYIR